MQKFGEEKKIEEKSEKIDTLYFQHSGNLKHRLLHTYHHLLHTYT